MSLLCCVQVVSGSSSWEHSIKVKKSKDLFRCTDRQDVQTIFQGPHYDSNSVSINAYLFTVAYYDY